MLGLISVHAFQACLQYCTYRLLGVLIHRSLGQAPVTGFALASSSDVQSSKHDSRRKRLTTPFCVVFFK